MATISRQEILRIAWLSRIALKEHEINYMGGQLDEVISYAHRVCDSASDVKVVMHKNVNVFREDVTAQKDAQAIMNEAPKKIQNYFVVPIVIEKE